MISRNTIGGTFPIRLLGDVVEFLDHMRRPVTESDRKAGPYPYYGANGRQGSVDGFIFDEPLVLLAEDGGHFESPERGIAYQISGKSWVNNHAHVLRPKPGLATAFLARVLEHYDVTPWVTGTTRGKLTKAGASQIPVPVPPLQEQQRIAEILEKADALRAKRRASLALVDPLTESVFIDMFGDVATNSKGWPEGATLGQVAEIVSGVTKGRNLSGKRTRSVPYLAVANVQDKALDLSVVKAIEASEEEIGRLRLRRDDLLLTEGGDPDKLGRGTLWGEQLTECIHQNHVFRVRLTTSGLHPVFLNWLVGSLRGKRYFLKSAKQTTGIASINMTQLRSFPLLTPPVGMQREFARRLAAVQEERRKLQSSLLGMHHLFASLQHRAFRSDL